MGTAPVSAAAQGVPLPAAGRDPLSIDPSTDPILKLTDRAVSMALFKDYLRRALDGNPAIREAAYGIDQQEAARREAKSALFPVVDLQISANKAIARNYSNDPDNIIERSRGQGRVDGTASVQQLLWDFGATQRRIDAATSRIAAAKAGEEQAIEREALRAIGAWYDVVAFGHLVSLAEVFAGNQDELMSALNLRIRQGVSAPVDRARVKSAQASANAQLASFERRFGEAKARFAEFYRVEPGNDTARAPLVDLGGISREDVLVGSEKTAVVRSAEANARAVASDAKAARADTYPLLSGGIDAGRYGVLQRDRDDYEVRGRLSLRYRLFGPGAARADQAVARAGAAEARAEAIRNEAIREASTAWAELSGLRNSVAAQREDYLAARITRDAVVERFRVARGTLFEVLDAEQRYFDSAANYIRLLSEHDAAVYVLLARSGGLLPALELEPDRVQKSR